MLVTLHKDGRSSFLGELDELAIDHEREQLQLAGLKPTDFTVELPYTTNGAAVLAPVLLAWRHARPGRSVTLTMHDQSSVEIGEVTAGRIEWLLPVVERIAIVEQQQD